MAVSSLTASLRRAVRSAEICRGARKEGRPGSRSLRTQAAVSGRASPYHDRNSCRSPRRRDALAKTSAADTPIKPKNAAAEGSEVERVERVEQVLMSSARPEYTPQSAHHAARSCSEHTASGAHHTGKGAARTACVGGASARIPAHGLPELGHRSELCKRSAIVRLELEAKSTSRRSSRTTTRALAVCQR